MNPDSIAALFARQRLRRCRLVADNGASKDVADYDAGRYDYIEGKRNYIKRRKGL